MKTLLNRAISPPTLASVLPEISFGKKMEENGTNYFHIPMFDPIARIDLSFNYGMLHEESSEVFKLYKELVFSGTDLKNEEEILDELDYLGAYYNVEAGMNFTTFTLYSTPELIDSALNIFTHAIFNANFPAQKLAEIKIEQNAHLAQSLNKTSYQASTLLNQTFYTQSALAIPRTEAQINAVTQAHLQAIHKAILSASTTIYFSGNFNNLEALKSSVFAQLAENKSFTNIIPVLNNDIKSIYKHKTMPDSVQTSYRAIAPCINKSHSDYPYLLLANTIFGGYFGSMLMGNIREDKGLTYGIQSHIAATGSYGHLKISADIKTNSIDLVRQEIQKEYALLTKGQFSDDLFNKTKRYVLGQLAKSCDDTFSALEKTKTVEEQGLSSSYYSQLFDAIKDADRTIVVNAALNHLKITEIIETTCGPEQ